MKSNMITKMIVTCLCMWAIGMAAEANQEIKSINEGVKTQAKVEANVELKKKIALKKKALIKTSLIKTQSNTNKKVAMYNEMKAQAYQTAKKVATMKANAYQNAKKASYQKANAYQNAKKATFQKANTFHYEKKKINN